MDQPRGSKFNQRRALVLAGGGASLGLLTGCASTGAPVVGIATPTQVPAPAVKAGDRWVYEDVNQYNRLVTGRHEVQVVSTSAGIALERKGSSASQPAAQEIYQQPWQVILEAAYDQPQRFDQPVIVVPADLRVGSFPWTSTTYTVEGVSRRLGWSEQLRVFGWQRLKLPAGEFDVLAIERRIRFEHSDYARQFSTRFDRLWYAPQVNRWVQREWSGQFLWGGRPRSPGREDWVLSRLVQYQPERPAGA